MTGDERVPISSDRGTNQKVNEEGHEHVSDRESHKNVAQDLERPAKEDSDVEMEDGEFDAAVTGWPENLGNAKKLRKSDINEGGYRTKIAYLTPGLELFSP